MKTSVVELEEVIFLESFFFLLLVGDKDKCVCVSE